MRHAGITLLLGWVLLTSVSTWKCDQTTCEPMRSGTSQVTQRLGPFATHEACTDMRAQIERQPLVRAENAAARITLEKRMSATCVRETP